MELCKTRAQKSSPAIFNFHVVFAGHNKLSDAGRATMCRLKCKVPSLKSKSTKNEGAFENMSFSKKKFEKFNGKKLIF